MMLKVDCLIFLQFLKDLARVLTRLDSLGVWYFSVPIRTNPSLQRKMRRGSQEVTRMQIRRSNLQPSIRKGLSKYSCTIKWSCAGSFSQFRISDILGRKIHKIQRGIHSRKMSHTYLRSCQGMLVLNMNLCTITEGLGFIKFTASVAGLQTMTRPRLIGPDVLVHFKPLQPFICFGVLVAGTQTLWYTDDGTCQWTSTSRSELVGVLQTGGLRKTSSGSKIYCHQAKLA